MKSNRTLTLHWIEGRPSLAGGIKSNRLIAEAMARRGHRVTIFHLPARKRWPALTQPRKLWKRAVREAIGLKGGPRHHLEKAAVPVRQFPGFSPDPEFVPDADVVFASWWSVWREVAGWPASKGLKVHLVRGHETYNTSQPREQIEAAYRLPGPKVVISTWLGRIMADYGHQECVRVPNGIDWKQFDSAPRKKQPTPKVGLLFARGAVKGPTVALNALRIVQQSIPEVCVVAFAKSPLASEWSLPDPMEFHLQPAQNLIPQLYQRCDCWVVPSRSEGFGMPGLEAAAGHCPIVSTRCGGPEDYVREGVNGYLVDVGDAEAMADRILRVLRMDNESWKRMSAASYEIAKEFDWDRSAEKLEAALYRWLDERRDNEDRVA